MKLACQEGLVPGGSLKEKLDILAACGYEGIEFWGENLRDRKDEILNATKGHTVTTSTICAGFRGSLLDPDKMQRDLAMSDIKNLLSLGGEIGALGLIVVPIFGGPRVPDLSPAYNPWQLEETLLVDLMGELGEHAADAGCYFLLEPLNRYETHFVKTLGYGVDLCKKAGSKGLRIMADFFHMSIEEENIPASIKASAEWIAHVHLADSTRMLPGYGHTDWKSGMLALKEIGYTGYMAMECGVPGDPKVELKKSADLIKTFIQ